ncbi:MAG: hypothetical protein LBN05_00475 [Oscillospiraceae bacterium]|jgi:hypothetical protein|nr:hypothetical protein [Oscillospiraceae bacterium]
MKRKTIAIIAALLVFVLAVTALIVYNDPRIVDTASLIRTATEFLSANYSETLLGEHSTVFDLHDGQYFLFDANYYPRLDSINALIESSPEHSPIRPIDPSATSTYGLLTYKKTITGIKAEDVFFFLYEKEQEDEKIINVRGVDNFIVGRINDDKVKRVDYYCNDIFVSSL